MGKLFKVGDYIQRFNTLTGQNLPCGPIYQSVGLVSHVKSHHPQMGTAILQLIPTIIQSPDYIGKNPREPNSIELVKKLSDNIMVCIKLDTQNGYLYVASVYNISQGKVNNRLNSGRLKRY